MFSSRKWVHETYHMSEHVTFTSFFHTSLLACLLLLPSCSHTHAPGAQTWVDNN